MTLDTEIKKAYSEVYEILKMVDKEYFDRIPKKFVEFLEREKDNNYIPNINENIPLEEQKLLNDTINILAMIKLDYWCSSEEEKSELLKLLNENEKKHRENINEKYNPENIFEKTTNRENKDLVEVKEKKWRKKFCDMFRNILKRRG